MTNEKETPLVSILIPTYNRPHYFKIALESAIAQTYSNIEIIIGDDSTDDETETLIFEQYLPNYKNITYIRNNPTLGQFHNDLILLEKSNGEYINFLMDDDVFYKKKIEKMMSYFLQNSNENLALVTSYRVRIDDDGHLIDDSRSTQRLYSEDTPLNGILLGDWMLKSGHNIIGEPTTTLFKKKLLTDPFGTLKGRQYACSVDMASWISLLSKGDAVYISEPLSQFRHHAGQQVHNKLLQGSEDFTHLVITSKEYGFLQNTTDYRAALLNAYQWCKNSLQYYHSLPDLIPDAHVRLSHCLDIIIKELNY
ncbi:glycosyltransferase family 2 protein [Bacillus cereus]|uniref:glycosyltransferase family 2 protein n=1 Tax=Bacillus cereus TaxID=1396 RepID=UPI000BFE5680|nr:glycosyltransferase [Bacillus cereus]MDR4985713.1 glycosyltransferase [Bacillus cereus]PGT19135.1 glycosyl transferase family 2 [Bacillus cereus]